MEYTPITEDNKATFVTWLTNMSKDLERLPEQPPTHNIFPGSTDGDVITIKDMLGNFIATLTGNKFIIPMLLFMVIMFGSCMQRPQYSSQPFYNEQGQQVMYVDRGDGTSFLMDYILYSTLFRQGGYNAINNYYRTNPNQFTNVSKYSNYYPKNSNGTLNKTTSAVTYSSPSRNNSNSSNSYSSSSHSYSSPSRSSYSSPSRSSSSYSSSSSRSYSSPSRR